MKNTTDSQESYLLLQQLTANVTTLGGLISANSRLCSENKQGDDAYLTKMAATIVIRTISKVEATQTAVTTTATLSLAYFSERSLRGISTPSWLPLPWTPWTVVKRSPPALVMTSISRDVCDDVREWRNCVAVTASFIRSISLCSKLEQQSVLSLSLLCDSLHFLIYFLSSK